MLVAQIRRVRKLIPELASVGVHVANLESGWPPCDWDDPADRDRLVSELVNDANELVWAAEDLTDSGLVLSEVLADAVALLALVAGQDVEPGERPSQWRITRRTVENRVISKVSRPDWAQAKTTPGASGRNSGGLSPNCGPMQAENGDADAVVVPVLAGSERRVANGLLKSGVTCLRERRGGDGDQQRVAELHHRRRGPSAHGRVWQADRRERVRGGEPRSLRPGASRSKRTDACFQQRDRPRNRERDCRDRRWRTRSFRSALQTAIGQRWR